MNDIAVPKTNGLVYTSQSGKMAASFDLNDADGKVKAFNAVHGDSCPWEKILGEKFTVQHVIVHKVNAPSMQTGEQVELNRIILISPTGEQITTCSETVLQALFNLSDMFGAPPWDPPVIIVPMKAESKRGMSFNTFKVG